MVDVRRPKFDAGTVVATPGALEALRLARQSAGEFVHRHVGGDWGEFLDEEDRILNDQAVTNGSRILSAFVLSTGEKLWVITEAADDAGHRAATTLLLPDEY